MASTDAPRRPGVYTVQVGAEATANDTPVVLVDISDSTNFPHSSSETTWCNVLGLHLSAEKASDGVYDIWLGVVVENDGTDGTAKWFDVLHLEAVGNPTDSTDRCIVHRDYTLGGGNPDGINCKVTSGALVYTLCGQSQANNANWINSTGRLSPAGAGAGATGKPAAGDVVAWVEEVSGTGTLDWSITLHYEAH